jgi:hypothetical protein
VHVFSESTDNGTVTVAPIDLNPNAEPKRANPDYSGSDQGTEDS